MPPEETQDVNPKEEETKKPADLATRIKAKLDRIALPVALTLSIVANLAGIVYFRSIASQAGRETVHEIPLGDYRFVAEEREPGQVTEAEFALHIALVPQAEKSARQMLEARSQRVRQDVEELLRTAHSGDFKDPLLKELKRQLQKQINATLGIRAVADVIVTQLQMEKVPQSSVTNREAKSPVPWVEPSSS